MFRCNFFLPHVSVPIVKETMKDVVDLSETSFEVEVLRADLPVVVDFYAP